MGYATQSDLETRFGAEELLQLSDRLGTGRINAGVVTAALGDADAAIEGYLAARYALPVFPVPALLRQIACDLARFYLQRTAPSEAARTGFQDAQALLKDLSIGRAVLVGAAVADPGTSPAAAGGRVQFVAPDRRLSAWQAS